MRGLAVVALALVIDLTLGDPPSRWHPVAWLGALVAAGQRRFATGGPGRLQLVGTALVIAVGAAAAVGGGVLTVTAQRLGPTGIVLEAIGLSLLLSARGLAVAARRVARYLQARDLAGARRAVGRDLVSRSTCALDRSQVASAAIESVAENLGDSIVAPILFYLAGGLPGAAVYRAVNTADAMVGYREGALEHFGKATARLDDLLNLVPARLAAGVLVLAAPLAGASARRALATMWRDHRRTASPNAGWPMAAMAGALGVTLEKPGAYQLGSGSVPDAEDIEAAIRVMTGATVLGVALLALGVWLIRVM
jgi:adenosylcobinamide-phosphate synthase